MRIRIDECIAKYNESNEGKTLTKRQLAMLAMPGKNHIMAQRILMKLNTGKFKIKKMVDMDILYRIMEYTGVRDLNVLIDMEYEPK